MIWIPCAFSVATRRSVSSIKTGFPLRTTTITMMHFFIEEMKAMFPGLSESCIGYLLKLAHGESLRTAKKLYNVATEFAAAQGSALTVKHLRDTHRQLLGKVCA